MCKPINELAEFGPYVFNLTQRILYRGAGQVPLAPRALALLEYLIQNRDRLVSKNELKIHVWSMPHMADNTIDRQVSDLRRALGEGLNRQSFIETKYKRGWRFAANVVITTETVTKTEVWPEQRTEREESTPKESNHGAFSADNASFRGYPAPDEAGASRKIGFAAAAVTAFALAMFVFLLYKPGADARVVKFTQITNDGRIKRGPLVTDGKRIYFVEFGDASPRIASVAISGGEVVPLHIPMSRATVADISPDGQTLLVESSDSPGGELWTVKTTNGECHRLTAVSGDAAWAPNGSTIAVSRISSLAVGGPMNSFRTMASFLTGEIRAPRWSPDGKRIRFSRFNSKNESISLWELDIRDNQVRPLSGLSQGHEWAAHGSWSHDGNFYFYEAGTHSRQDLWVEPEKVGVFSLDRRKPQRLTNGPASWSWPLPLYNGSDILAINASTRSELSKWDSGSKSWQPEWDGAAAYELDYSRDGRWVVFSEPDHTIWKSKADGSGRVQLTDATLEAHQPHWSADSRNVAFMGQKSDGQWRIFIVSADGGPPEQLSKSGDDQGVPTWSVDGRYILYGERLGRKPRAEMSLHLQDVATREVRTLEHSSGLWSPRFSPDGKYIAAVTSDSKALRIAKWSDGDWNEAARMRLIEYPAWSADSRYIYFTGQREVAHYEVFRFDVPNVRLERVIDLKGFSLADENWFGVAPDGSPLVSRGIFHSEIWMLKCSLP